MLCAHPLQINKNDDLPKHICTVCLSKLRIAHHFRLKCLNTNSILKTQNVDKQKRNSIDEQTEEQPTKKKIKVETSTPKYHKYERGNFQKVFVKSIITDKAIEKKLAEIHDEQPSASTSNVDDSESDGIEAVLAMLEGKEQFIIEKTNVKPKTPDEDVMKATTKKKMKLQQSKRMKDSSVFPASIEKGDSNTLRSEIGEFPAKIIKSVYNNTFCLADEYLFEFGLIKQGKR